MNVYVCKENRESQNRYLLHLKKKTYNILKKHARTHVDAHLLISTHIEMQTYAQLHTHRGQISTEPKRRNISSKEMEVEMGHWRDCKEAMK